MLTALAQILAGSVTGSDPQTPRWADSSFLGQTYPATSVLSVSSAVKSLSTAIRDLELSGLTVEVT